MAPKETTTVTIAALKDLKDRAGKAVKLERDLKKEKTVTAKLESDIKTLEENYTALKQEYDAMAVDVTLKASKIQELEKKLNEAPAQSAEATKPTKAKVKKADLNQELVNHVNQTTKTVLFRTCKFIEDALEEEEVTRELIPYLPVEIGMPEAEFVANYKNVVYEAIKGCRTEVQSSGKKRAKELFDKLGNLPTTEQLLQVLVMTPEDLEKPGNSVQKKIQEWYTDRYLPVVAGSEYWGDNIRHFKLPTDTCKLTTRNGTAEEKVLVTISSEGFGLLTYDNCRDKWNNIMQLKADNPGATIPRKGPEAAAYEAKWTLTKEGQKKFGGWKVEGMDRFGQLQDAIEEIRKKDSANAKAKQEYNKRIVRQLHKIADECTGPESSSGKKRARTPSPTPIDPSKRKVKRRKE